jgi:nucleotide-binding universal stress UspA family protein
MSAYSTVVVGTDGSETSFVAVERAAAIAQDAGATLVLACAYIPAADKDTARDRDILGDEAYQVVGSAPADDTVRTAMARASSVAGSITVQTEVVQGKPADVLTKITADRKADLLVVGNRGLNTLAGRILGSVPLDVLRHAGCDVLVVHTT